MDKGAGYPASELKMGGGMNTKDLYNRKVWVSHPKKNNPDAVKKTGRIHAFVFHPSKPYLVGFLVKRPDIALMFHRQDMFVAFNGFDIFDKDIVLRDESDAVGRGATKALGVNLDQCTIWLGLPVLCENGTSLGHADNVEFDPQTGRVLSLSVSGGATANTLLGRRGIPGDMIKGFRHGRGAQLALTDDGDVDPAQLGAVIVDDEAAAVEASGGVAEKAGEATAVATDKAKKTYKKVVRKAKPVAADVAEKAGAAAKVADEAVQKGAFATGRQIARTEGMFSNFKKEFKRGMQGEEDE